MNSDDKQIGERLQVLRGSTISQAGLAEAMRARGHEKWSQATVWSIESGRRPLRLAEASALASILNTEVDDFLLSTEANKTVQLLREEIENFNVQLQQLDEAVGDFELAKHGLRQALLSLGQVSTDDWTSQEAERLSDLGETALSKVRMQAEQVVDEARSQLQAEVGDYGVDL